MKTDAISQRHVAEYAIKHERVRLGLALGEGRRSVVGVGRVHREQHHAGAEVSISQILAAVMSAQRYAVDYYGFEWFVHQVMLFPTVNPSINGYTDCALQIFRRHACGEAQADPAPWASIENEYPVPAEGEGASET